MTPNGAWPMRASGKRSLVPDFILHWHQFAPEQVNAWEFQFQRVGSREWEWVQRVDPVDGCVDCFQATVELPRTALLVRSRSIGSVEVSAWSRELQVHSVPEPGFTAALLIGVLWLALRPARTSV